MHELCKHPQKEFAKFCIICYNIKINYSHTITGPTKSDKSTIKNVKTLIIQLNQKT